MFYIQVGEEDIYAGPFENKLGELRERSGVFNWQQQFLKDQVDIKRKQTMPHLKKFNHKVIVL